MRHINFFSGDPKWGVLGGGQKVMLKEFMCFFGPFFSTIRGGLATDGHGSVPSLKTCHENPPQRRSFIENARRNPWQMVGNLFLLSGFSRQSLEKIINLFHMDSSCR